jgi:hypothetical protein
VARRVLPWSVAHRPKVYGMDFDAAGWIEKAADPVFLNDGLLREKLGIPSDEFAGVLSGTEGLPKLRLWSAEVWCRSVFEGNSIEEIEGVLWR